MSSSEQHLGVFADWILQLNADEPPPEDIGAINFGLFESPEGYRIYVSGSRNYDPISDDWACEQDYCPGGRYYPEVFDAGLDWQEMQSEAAILVRQFLSSSFASKSFLSRPLIVVVGFDDGDLERIR